MRVVDLVLGYSIGNPDKEVLIMVYSKIAFKALRWSAAQAEKQLARYRKQTKRASDFIIKPKLPRPGKKKKTTRRKK